MDEDYDWQSLSYEAGLHEEEGFEFGEGEGIVEEDIEFRADYKQLQQVSYGRGGAIIEGIDVRLQKSLRTPEEVAIEQIYGILGSSVFADIPEGKRKAIAEYLEKFPRIHLYHLETLALAGLFMIEKITLNKKEFGKFVKRYASKSSVNQLDLLRYLRMFKSKKSK